MRKSWQKRQYFLIQTSLGLAQTRKSLKFESNLNLEFEFIQNFLSLTDGDKKM